MSVITGRELAIASNHLVEDPLSRLDFMENYVKEELVNLIQSNPDPQQISQGNRKLDSIKSLKVLAHALDVADLDWSEVEKIYGD